MFAKLIFLRSGKEGVNNCPAPEISEGVASCNLNSVLIRAVRITVLETPFLRNRHRGELVSFLRINPVVEHCVCANRPVRNFLRKGKWGGIQAEAMFLVLLCAQHPRALGETDLRKRIRRED